MREKLYLHKVKIAVAFALATEWALAFAFARHFANAVADADAYYADADANALNILTADVTRLHARVGALEQGRGYTSDHEPGRPRSARGEGSRG